MTSPIQSDDHDMFISDDDDDELLYNAATEFERSSANHQQSCTGQCKNQYHIVSKYDNADIDLYIDNYWLYKKQQKLALSRCVYVQKHTMSSRSVTAATKTK